MRDDAATPKARFGDERYIAEALMQLGMIGLGRMGGNMVRRLVRAMRHQAGAHLSVVERHAG